MYIYKYIVAWLVESKGGKKQQRKLIVGTTGSLQAGSGQLGRCAFGKGKYQSGALGTSKHNATCGQATQTLTKTEWNIKQAYSAQSAPLHSLASVKVGESSQAVLRLFRATAAEVKAC